MRAAPLLVVAIVLAGCLAPVPGSGGPAGCPATNAWFGLSPQPATIYPGSSANVSRIDVLLHACSASAPLVVERTMGGAGNCVDDFLVVDLVQGNRTWDLRRDVNGSALAPPPFALPCPPATSPNTTVAPEGELRWTYGWNGTIASTACTTNASATRCEGSATFEPAPVGTYELVARARVNGQDLESRSNVTVAAPGLYLLAANFSQTYAAPLNLTSVKAALLDMGLAMGPPCDCDMSGMESDCWPIEDCARVEYRHVSTTSASPTVQVALPNEGTRYFGADSAAARRAADALCHDLAANATAMLAQFDARANATPTAGMTCVADPVMRP